jgi:single stranded DNA-binding protein
MNETWVTIVGNVAGDVTKRRTAAGDVVNFRVMSSERRYDAASGEWQDGAQFSARVTCWRRLAENVHRCVVKGDPVVINGKLAVREYEVEGQRRSSTEIEAKSVGLDLRKVAAGVLPDERAADGSAAPVDVTSLPELPADAPMFRSEEADSPGGSPLVAVGSEGSVDSLLHDVEDDEFVRGAMAS